MSLFPCVNLLRERANAYYSGRSELLRSHRGPERKKKIADMIRRAAESGKNFINVHYHWMTDELREELTEGRFRIHHRIRTADRDAEDFPVETSYYRISW